ncbi:transmembrane protein, putative (macronuclear) [Tetrahymena thermophila SB210]|uniref:Transmembrane protein, putative n=1 Tax=Tetrahymena thermophila (strain SB210) TaxID=312017 RepID=W7XIA4_TETTS|nr:transmembrane protein, putative [Tetrahymena thermophila SB210]EWS73124.1 transmembrane protein, putative [Tetrahymena thermophila SB210]|eukprot:XP_012654311.1 transmembrane protein, putative [Tetrahymena thermophila SB210]
MEYRDKEDQGEQRTVNEDSRKQKKLIKRKAHLRVWLLNKQDYQKQLIDYILIIGKTDRKARQKIKAKPSLLKVISKKNIVKLPINQREYLDFTDRQIKQQAYSQINLQSYFKKTNRQHHSFNLNKIVANFSIKFINTCFIFKGQANKKLIFIFLITFYQVQQSLWLLGRQNIPDLQF